MLQRFFAGIVRRASYRHGLPFITAIAIALVTIGRFQPTRPTSIWTFALLAFIATTFALLCGGRFRTTYVAIAVAPPFLVALQWFLRMRSWLPDQPFNPVVAFFLSFVSISILIVWLSAMIVHHM